jgi:hypothetical protein
MGKKPPNSLMMPALPVMSIATKTKARASGACQRRSRFKNSRQQLEERRGRGGLAEMVAPAALTLPATALTSFAAAASNLAGGPWSVAAFGIDGGGSNANEVPFGAVKLVFDKGVGVALRGFFFCMQGEAAAETGAGSGRYQWPSAAFMRPFVAMAVGSELVGSRARKVIKDVRNCIRYRIVEPRQFEVGTDSCSTHNIDVNSER